MSKDIPAFPPSYNEVTVQHASPGGGLTFCDFLPECIEKGGMFNQRMYDPFNILVDRANNWLASQYYWEVKTCESVEFMTPKKEVNSKKMVFCEKGESTNYYTRGLRLWLVPRTDPTRPPQQIGYMNLVPQVIKLKGVFGTNKQYENLDAVLERFNTLLHINPLPGRILTVESQEVKVRKISSFNPDKSYWYEVGDSQRTFAFIIRIFYEQGVPAIEEIGLADFVPMNFTKKGLFSMPLFETFPYVLKRASEWCAQQTSVRFCNAQSVGIKIKQNQKVDTKLTSYVEYGTTRTHYLRIVRVAFVKLPMDQRKGQEGMVQQIPPPLHLNYKTFVPLKLVKGHWVKKYETLLLTRQRMEAWIRVTGARVLGAETVAMPLFNGRKDELDTEVSIAYNAGDNDQYHIYIIRLYLDGFYEEPPKEVLPPDPILEEENCMIV